MVFSITHGMKTGANTNTCTIYFSHIVILKTTLYFCKVCHAGFPVVVAQWNTSSEPNLAVQLSSSSVYVISSENMSPLPFGRHAPDLA
jgi:hypothetical protein